MIGVILCLVLGVAHAADTTDPAPTGAISKADAEHAEYVRLSQELEKLASRNAWPGVERTYNDLVATGVVPSFDDHMYGAHSARELGDISAAHTRLLAANAIKEDKQVLDWLWEIDSTYGQVFLAADPGATALKAAVMPFEPDQARAVEFAAAKIAESGVFQGYLPQGKYTFGDYEVNVLPRQSPSIDLRTGDDAKPPKKPKKAKGS